MIGTYTLSEDERAEVGAILERIGQDAENREEHRFLDRAPLLAQELPVGVRRAFLDFRLRETTPCLLVTGNPIEPDDVGATPTTHWRPGMDRPLNAAQQLHGLYTCLLGDPFGFASQQFGRVFNDLITLPGQPANASSGSGKIGLHTEDCVKPFMPDYLGLACLRNETGAQSLVSSIRGMPLPEDVRNILFEPIFAQLGGGSRRPLLFGAPDQPYLRYGSIDAARCDERGQRALRYLTALLSEAQRSVTLQAGDSLYIDNFHAVHGRAPFEPRFGAHARWFSRIIVTRDLRRTRALRSAPEGRVMREP
jgi:L-asparagine oxygenase